MMASQYDEEIYNIIMNTSSNEYDGIIRDANWEIFSELSPMREGLVSWYPFRSGSRVLYCSSGFGALTGVLARKCEAVVVLAESEQKQTAIEKRFESYSNIVVVMGTLQQYVSQNTFDYVLIDAEVKNRRELDVFLKDATRYLKDNGILLFACSNRFGMKYWCGVPDVIKGIPFGSLRENGSENVLTRQDLMDVLEGVYGTNGWNIYYPFPDAQMPQAIYTDTNLPAHSVRDRVISYYTPEQRKGLIFTENDICDGLIRNKLFHVFANSFLVECSKKNVEQQVSYVTLSTDRGKEHGFATIIFNNGVVHKMCLFDEGKSALKLICNNQEELQKHGIKCVEQFLKEGYIEMPYVKDCSLIDLLKGVFFNQKEQVEKVFEQLYGEILRSSEPVEFESCAMNCEGLDADLVGTILKKAYIDMIPYNCFVKENEFLFYDQEFVKENFPAKYVLFRALRYTYIFIKEAESIIPLQYFKNKFGLNELWPLFEREEAIFVEDNRNYELMSSFYQWASVEQEFIDRNVAKLLQAEGQETVQIVPAKLKRGTKNLEKHLKDVRLNAMKDVQLEMLKEFSEICNAHKLSYCAIYGTLLGAIRHEGFIPWDDDIDLVMPRADYDRLVELAPTILKAPYFFQTPENDKECFYGGYGKFRKSDTAGLEQKNKGHNCNQGMWLDVFPLDRIPANPQTKKKQELWISLYQRALFQKVYPEEERWKKITENRFLVKLLEHLPHQFLCKKLKNNMISFEGEASTKLCILARFAFEKERTEYECSDFEFVMDQPFEEMTIPIPNGFEACLIKDFGVDYMMYPKEEERVPHHRALFFTDIPYKQAIEEKKDEAI